MRPAQWSRGRTRALAACPLVVALAACPSPSTSEDAGIAADASTADTLERDARAALDAPAPPLDAPPTLDARPTDDAPGSLDAWADDAPTTADALVPPDAFTPPDAFVPPDAWAPACFNGIVEPGELCLDFPSIVASAFMFASPDVHVADLNGDTHPDIAYTDDSDATGFLRVMLRVPATGSYTTVTSTLLAGPGDFQLVDMTGDGVLDLVYLSTRSGNVAIARGAGDGTFTALSQASAQVGVLAVADFTGDGALDVAIRDSSLTGLRVLPTDGAGHLGAAITVDAAARPVALASGDLDGDGDADLAWIEESAALARATRGAASWSATSSVALSGSNYAAMALYDVDGDHQLDALLGSYTIELVGSLTAAPRAIGTRRAFDLAVADIDQDGRRDVVAGGESALLTLRDTTGDWVAATGLPAISGTAYRIDAADLDEDGALDLVVSLLGSGTRDIVLVHAHP